MRGDEGGAKERDYGGVVSAGEGGETGGKGGGVAGEEAALDNYDIAAAQGAAP